MAVFTGTAAGHVDLLNKIVGHLTDAGSMGSQVWQLLLSRTVAGNPTTEGSMEERYLKGPGLAGTDSIYVNLRTFQNVGADTYNLSIRGAVNFNGALPMETQPGTSAPGYALLWQSATPYWLIANGRRFILIAKVSTTYACCYCGFYLPYSTSAEMPYPMYIGTQAYDSRRWSTTTYIAGSFFDPSCSGSSYPPASYSAQVRHFDGSWQPICNYYESGGTRSALYKMWVWPWNRDWPIGPNRDGNYPLLPAILGGDYSGGNTYGELQGVYWCTGFGNAAENTITVAGKNYLVVPSTQRTSRRDYAAILLE